MEYIVRPLSIKVIYWLTNITFWIYIVMTIIAIGLVGVLLLFDINNLELQVGIPVKALVKEVGTLDVNIASKLINVEMAEMSGKAHFKDTPAIISKVYALFIFGIVLLFLYIFLIFKRFISNVYDGVYFDYNNISLLKRISYTLVIIWLFTIFYAYFQYFFIVINLNFDTIEFTSNVETYPEILLIALFIWVLSHIFSKGCELQDENKLTV